jgi:hypothetical protein
MGAMESLPENQQRSDLWWGENAANRNVSQTFFYVKLKT